MTHPRFSAFYSRGFARVPGLTQRLRAAEFVLLSAATGLSLACAGEEGMNSPDLASSGGAGLGAGGAEMGPRHGPARRGMPD